LDVGNKKQKKRATETRECTQDVTIHDA
jgi:hypothetical protein